jgi:hypothetical protein
MTWRHSGSSHKTQTSIDLPHRVHLTSVFFMVSQLAFGIGPQQQADQFAV